MGVQALSPDVRLRATLLRRTAEQRRWADR